MTALQAEPRLFAASLEQWQCLICALQLGGRERWTTSLQHHSGIPQPAPASLPPAPAGAAQDGVAGVRRALVGLALTT